LFFDAMTGFSLKAEDVKGEKSAMPGMVALVLFKGGAPLQLLRHAGDESSPICIKPVIVYMPWDLPPWENYRYTPSTLRLF
jgi:hypothetical protein